MILGSLSRAHKTEMCISKRKLKEAMYIRRIITYGEQDLNQMYYTVNFARSDYTFERNFIFLIETIILRSGVK